MRQIELIEPRVIATLGNFATKTLTRSPVGITRCCGRPQAREVAGLDVTIYPLFHPAAALRTPKVLEQLRGDFARIPALIESPRPADPPQTRPAGPSPQLDAERAQPPPGLEPEAAPAPPPQLDLFG
jgi:DNA polymerase